VVRGVVGGQRLGHERVLAHEMTFSKIFGRWSDKGGFTPGAGRSEGGITASFDAR
jgi:hypothetical protein